MSSAIQVNSHYLDNLLELSRIADIEASEDIYTANGIKLIAKGAQLNASMQERLIRHKLTKPLETSMRLRNDDQDHWLPREIANVLSDARYQPLLGTVSIPTIQQLFNQLDTKQPGIDLVLTLIQRIGRSELPYILLTASLAVRIGLQLNLSAEENKALALAGLVHEVGHLYLDPSLHSTTQKRTPPIWRQLAAHPIIGSLALSQLPTILESTVRAVKEQHERLDGSGYPAGIQGKDLHLSSQIINISSTLANLWLRHGDNGLWQMEVSMHLMPGEYDKRLVSALIELVHSSGVPYPELADHQTESILPALFMHIGALQLELTELEDRFSSNTSAVSAWLSRMNQRLFSIQRTFSSTGLDFFRHKNTLGHQDGAGLPATELILIDREIRRRLHDFGISATLQVALLPEPIQAAATPWLERLLSS